MDRIKNVRLFNCNTSIYMKPVRMEFEQDGRKRFWDLMSTHDSVAIIIFNISKEVLVFVRQFRPAVYYNKVKSEDCDNSMVDVDKYPPSLGITLELCEGLCDKDQSLVEIARDEVLEECGYSCPLSEFIKVTSIKSGDGVSSSTETLFYVEVTDSMRVSEGGGLASEGEYIDVVELSLPEAKSLIYDENVPRNATLVLGLTWFFTCKMQSEI